MKQDRPNVSYTSPLGSCDVANPPFYCPNPADKTNPESYYACPAEGCATYVVRLDDPSVRPRRIGLQRQGSDRDLQLHRAWRQETVVRGAAGHGREPASVLRAANLTAPYPDGAVVVATPDPSAKPGLPHSLAFYQSKRADPICTGAP